MWRKAAEVLRNIEIKDQHRTNLGLTRSPRTIRDRNRCQHICHGSFTNAAKEVDMFPFREVLSGYDKLSHLLKGVISLSLECEKVETLPDQ